MEGYFKYVLIFIIAIICYINSIDGDFVFDDNEAIVNNADVDTFKTSWLKVFEHDFWGNSISHQTSHKSYRPFTVLFYRLNYWFAGGRSSFHFHMTNILLHPFVVLVYMLVCQSVLQQVTSATSKFVNVCTFTAGLLFATHPIHSECVAGIVGCAELTSALFYFASFYCYIKCISSHYIWLLICLILAVSAMLFKEQGITVLGICVLFDITVNMKIDFKDFKTIQNAAVNLHFMLRVLLVCLTTSLALWLRYVVMVTGAPSFHAMDNPSAHAKNMITRVLTYNYIYSLNGWLLLNPWWLCFDWSMGCVPLLESVFDIRILAVVIFWSILGSLIFYSSLTTSGQAKQVVGVCLSWLIVPFLPASNMFFPVGFVIAERVLYIPSSGYCLLISYGFYKLLQHRHLKKMAPILIMIVVGLFISRSIHRTAQWSNEEKLFTSAVDVCPNNAKVHYNIGKTLSDKGYIELAESKYRHAIKLYPDYDQALNNLGNLLKETNRPVEAESVLQKAVTISPEFAAAWMNLGIVQAHLKKYQEAELSYRTAIHHRHNYTDAYYNLGNLYLDLNQPKEAVGAFKKAISLKQDHFNSWNNLGLLFQNLNQLKDAETVFREACSIMPQKADFHFSLGVVLGKQGLYEEGEKELLKAIELEPTRGNFFGNLGVIYHLNKRYDLAEIYYRKALEIEANLTETSKNLEKLMSVTRHSP